MTAKQPQPANHHLLVLVLLAGSAGLGIVVGDGGAIGISGNDAPVAELASLFGAPQLGQVNAEVLSSWPHSEHSVRGIGEFGLQ